MRGTALALGLTLAVVGAGSGQDRPDSTRRDTTAQLPALEVQGIRPLTTVGGSSALRVRLDSVPLPPAPTLEQTLRQLPFLHLRRNSRGEAELSGRGSESRQVAVLVDGIPITLAWDARTDVSVIPATGFQDVHYIRGLSSMLHGPNVLGGIIEVGVGQASFMPSHPSADFAVGFDHVGGYGGGAGISLPLVRPSGTWLVRAGTSFRDTPGVTLARGVDEPLPTDHDLRLNTDAENIDGFVAVRYEGHGGGWVSFSGSSFRAERGIAAELGYDDARFWRYPHQSRSLLVLSGGTGDRRSPLGGRGDLEASFGVDLGRTDIDAYTSRTYSELDGFENGKDRTLTLRLLGDQSLGQRGELRTAFTLSEIRHDEFLPSADARYRQRLWSLGGETIWRLVDQGQGINSLRLSLGGAYDVGQTPESGGREPRQGTLSEWGARVGLTMVAADGRLLAHGGVSRRGRFPALRELYSGALDRFAPSPELQPENLVAIEAGITTRLGDNSEIQLVGFHHLMNDAVVRITLPDNRFMRVNRNRLESIGIELLGSTLIGPLAVGGDLTLQSVDLTDTDAGITNRPENLPEAFGGAYVRLRLPLGIRTGTELRYTGSQFCIDPATGDDTELQSGTVVNANVSREWRLRPANGGWLSRLEARLALDNIGNVALYGQCRLPDPGRLVRLQVRLF
ncbi:MAG TPA: TonB-dependent receptor plug domain-containing protein [Gemmatimonadales bacterium]